MYKKSTVLDQYRKKQGPVIIVDSGDLLNGYGIINEYIQSRAKRKGDLIARIYQYMGIDAINVGELDLALGPAYLKALEKRYDLPLVSANLVDDTNSPVFKPYIIRKINGRRIGIFGLMGDTADMVVKVKEITAGQISVLDLVQSAKCLVRELSGKVDFIIAMTHQHMGRNWVLARKVNGIDLIVGGHHTQRINEPYLANRTYIVQSGEKGQYQGILEMTLHSDGTRTTKNRLIPLGHDVSDDLRVKAIIDLYNEKALTQKQQKISH